jgi:Protein of unknown function (DUF3987)
MEQAEFIRRAMDEADAPEEKQKPYTNGHTGDAPIPPGPSRPKPLSEAAYHGIAGEFVRLVEPHTEADPAALMFQLLAYSGNCFGDRAYYLVEETRHYPNLFVTIVGATASARKGTSRKRIQRLMREAAPTWEVECVSSGLSTGEGLIARVRDPEYGTNKKGETELVHQGAKDKRLLIVEEEFSRPLRVMERNNNTLAAVLRQAWDGDRLSILTREDPIKASGAIVSIIGHVTQEELKAELTEVNTANGLGNRFLWPLVSRSRSLPFGGDDCSGGIIEIATRLRQAIEGAASGIIRFDEAARHQWIDVYETLNEDRPGLVGAMTARSAAQTIRVALVYALLDRQHLIGSAHLAAALEIVRYSNDSVRRIFSDATGNSIADAILAAVRSSPEGLTRTEINHDLFGRNVRAERIAAAISELLAGGKVRIDRRDTTGGRPADLLVAINPA